ncbi:hypothetical protein UPYG_G00323690 [Umbra pygmaea]|uniref:Cyclic GMP-AMP synthase n=1 Tax=Umbra pygmaea TaxID=75934 RepID=A0ABD0W2K8_UMBPY
MSRRDKPTIRAKSPARSKTGREKPPMRDKSPAPSFCKSPVPSKGREKPQKRDKSPAHGHGRNPVRSNIGREKPPERKVPAPVRGKSPVRARNIGNPNETMKDTKGRQQITEQDEIKKTKAPKQPTRISEGKTAMVQLKETASLTMDRKGDRVHSNTEKVLAKTLALLKLKKTRISESASVVNEVVDLIKAHMNKNTKCFEHVSSLKTGSYYENVKISDPDEFDVMFPVPIRRVNVRPFGTDGAFYSVELKREKHSLEPFLQDDNTLSASEMLTAFRNEVKTSVKERKDVILEKKKKGCPAVTLLIGEVPISLDIVLGLEVRSSWPAFTSEGFKIENWLGTKVKKDLKSKPYYLVPKYEGNGTKENDGVLAKDAWRISFSHVEKFVLKNHGSLKTCCEAGGTRCCRKDCLKLLKHLLDLLKKDYSCLSKFCSYHVKTTLLHACCSRPHDNQWEAAQLGLCFQQLLGDFVRHLKDGKLPNFFIPEQNLLGSGIITKNCKFLAQLIEEEQNNGFPIFCKREETSFSSS